MQLLLLSRGARKLYFWYFFGSIAIAIEPDDRASPIVNLLLVPMRSVLNLAALITVFDRGKNATQPFDLAEFVENGRFYPGEPLNMFMVCLKMPDSSSRIACP